MSPIRGGVYPPRPINNVPFLRPLAEVEVRMKKYETKHERKKIDFFLSHIGAERGGGRD